MESDFSATALYASLVVSTLGLAFFVYGKKQRRFPHLVGGLLMMGVPYMFTSAAYVTAFGVAAVAGILVAGRLGY